jgi:hypothetical protein
MLTGSDPGIQLLDGFESELRVADYAGTATLVSGDQALEGTQSLLVRGIPYSISFAPRATPTRSAARGGASQGGDAGANPELVLKLFPSSQSEVPARRSKERAGKQTRRTAKRAK